MCRRRKDGEKREHKFNRFEGVGQWLMLIAFVLEVVAFATDGWQESTDPLDTYPQNASIGLWGSCHCEDITAYTHEDWYKATQAFTTMALIFKIIVFILSIAYMFAKDIDKVAMLTAICVFLFFAVVFILIGVSIFGAFTSRAEFGGGGQSYSFILAVITMAFTLVSAILTIMRINALKAARSKVGDRTPTDIQLQPE